MSQPLTVLLVEDDPNDRMLFRRAVRKIEPNADVKDVLNGEEMLDYLNGKGLYSDRQSNPLPNCLLMDLKMPRMSGLEVLAWLREHPQFRIVPTVIFSSSNDPNDVQRAYELGANAYFTKPSSADERDHLLRVIFEHWRMAERPRAS